MTNSGVSLVGLAATNKYQSRRATYSKGGLVEVRNELLKQRSGQIVSSPQRPGDGVED